MSLAATRAFLRDQLAAELGFAFADGLAEGPFPRQDAGFVALLSGGETEDVEVEQLEFRVRVYRKLVATRSPQQPADPEPLEQLVESVYSALRDVQASPAAGVWFFRATGFEIDYDAQGVEVTVLALRQNPFTA